MFHRSFSEDILPAQLKVAKDSLVFKAGDIEEAGNYKVISVFPILPKVLERTMYYRTNLSVFQRKWNNLSFK